MQLPRKTVNIPAKLLNYDYKSLPDQYKLPEQQAPRSGVKSPKFFHQRIESRFKSHMQAG
jgi:hypothetical protein